MRSIRRLPLDDAEFDSSSPHSWLLTATGYSDASGRIDLLTVVMHEFGHVLGFDDLDPEAHSDDLMSAMLNTGQRHLIPLPDSVLFQSD